MCPTVKVESGSGGVGPSLCVPACLQSRWRFDGGATRPRPRQLFHHERHLSHRALFSRKLQLKLKATTLSDMYPGGVGMNSACSLLNTKIHSLTHWGILVGFKNITWWGQIKGRPDRISPTNLSSYLWRRRIHLESRVDIDIMLSYEHLKVNLNSDFVRKVAPLTTKRFYWQRSRSWSIVRDFAALSIFLLGFVKSNFEWQ